MSEKIQCKGGCGKESSHGDVGKGGYALGRGDKYIEWVCDECWHNGKRLTKLEDVKE